MTPLSALWRKRASSIKLLLAGAISAALPWFAGESFAAGAAPQPNICTRACWGASAGTTSYMSALTRAIVHHTAGSEFNTSGLEASKANVRAIQSLHKSNGWGDIGYHFLVDKYGNILIYPDGYKAPRKNGARRK